MLRMMNVLESEEDIDKLLIKCDPDNNKKMTYSEVVSVLSSEMVPRDPDSNNPSRKIAILEKFISESEDLDDEINAYRNATHIDETNQDLPDQSEMDQEQTEANAMGDNQNDSGEMMQAGEDESVNASYQ